MRAYIIRRLLLVIPTLFILSILVFLSVRFIPGDVIDVMQSRMGGLGRVDREQLEQMLGLDQPVYVQYGRWLGDILLHGTLGRSLMGDWAVEERILGRLPVTIELGVMAIVIGLLIALPVGIYSAIRQDTAVDYAGRSIAVLGLATPNFWLALMVMISAHPGPGHLGRHRRLASAQERRYRHKGERLLSVRAGDWRLEMGDTAAPCASQYRGSDNRCLQYQRRRGDYLGGGVELPWIRPADRGSQLGWSAQQGGTPVHGGGATPRLLARPGSDGYRVQPEHARRRGARPARPAAEGWRWSSRCRSRRVGLEKRNQRNKETNGACRMGFPVGCAPAAVQEQPFDVGRLVHVITVLFAQLAKGLHADGQSASGQASSYPVARRIQNTRRQCLLLVVAEDRRSGCHERVAEGRAGSTWRGPRVLRSIAGRCRETIAPVVAVADHLIQILLLVLGQGVTEGFGRAWLVPIRPLMVCWRSPPCSICSAPS